ncbi:hypothetical protein FACS1894187_10930 [Synergistales bacterium]|nr:hypothetical protein FACS1894187_10930 [Synergistales bacterium]
MDWQPRQPVKLGAERREREASVLRDVEATASVARVSVNKKKCPDCGSEHYYPKSGCMVCEVCGYTPCGVH